MASNDTKAQQKDYADRLRNVCRQRQTGSGVILQLFTKLVNENNQKNTRVNSQHNMA